MTFKRLYYDFALHGGAVGVHDLGQGSSYDHQLFFSVLAFYVFVPVLGNTDLDLGTLVDPQSLLGNQDMSIFGPGVNRLAVGSWEFTATSHWALTVNTSPITAGLVEFIFDTHRRQ